MTIYKPTEKIEKIKMYQIPSPKKINYFPDYKGSELNTPS
jgi:hypothetical protein